MQMNNARQNNRLPPINKKTIEGFVFNAGPMMTDSMKELNPISEENIVLTLLVIFNFSSV